MRRSSDSRRLFLSVAGGLTFALALLFGAGAFSPHQANAQAAPSTPPKYFDPITQQEYKTFREVMKSANQTADLAKRESARNILNRQALRTVPRFAPAVLGAGSVAAAGATTAGLGALAVGAWGVVGLELYYLPCWECEVQIVSVTPELKAADGAYLSTVTGPSGSGSIGTAKTQAWITYASASRDQNANVSATVYGQRRVISWYHWTDGSRHQWSSYTPSINLGGMSGGAPWSDLNATTATAPDYLKNGNFEATRQTTNTVSVGINGKPHDGSPVGSDGYRRKELCPAGYGPCHGAIEFPTIDTGSWSGNKAADSPTLRATPQESNDFINSVVADPATPEVVPEEDQPAPMEPDPDWDPNTDPFNPLFDPFSDPQGDPDGDGIPNETDPDPEGDEDPDGDGDPNEHPRPIPYGPTDDPEGDGDTDGDGDPDETNPYAPQPDPYDPQTQPDADPDDDGIPNTDDPDPVNPTDPQTLPQEHPYADPDTDGQPNREDPDDDGDGIPDEDDPRPFVPTDPSELPDDDPYADPDGDGEPNKDDQDDDGDGAPDTSDPSPFNPSEPGTDPDGDGDPNESDPDDDGDGVPDTEDPAPTTPRSPTTRRRQTRTATANPTMLMRTTTTTARPTPTTLLPTIPPSPPIRPRATATATAPPTPPTPNPTTRRSRREAPTEIQTATAPPTSGTPLRPTARTPREARRETPTATGCPTRRTPRPTTPTTPATRPAVAARLPARPASTSPSSTWAPSSPSVWSSGAGMLWRSSPLLRRRPSSTWVSSASWTSHRAPPPTR